MTPSSIRPSSPCSSGLHETTSTSSRATRSVAPTTSPRRVIGRVYHRFVALAFGLEIRDTDCDFRLIRMTALDRITLVHSTGVICVELVKKLQDSGARFVEVPVHHYPREHGQSQFFNFSSVVRSLRDLVGLWFGEVMFRRSRASSAVPEREERAA